MTALAKAIVGECLAVAGECRELVTVTDMIECVDRLARKDMDEQVIEAEKLSVAIEAGAVGHKKWERSLVLGRRIKALALMRGELEVMNGDG